MRNTGLCLLLFLLLILLSSCAAKPATVESNTFIDPNVPSIIINFPFEIELESRKVEYQNESRAVTFKLNSGNNFRQIFIYKQEVDTSTHIFLGTDASNLKKSLSIKKFGAGYCSINIHKEDTTDYLMADIIKYYASEKVVRVRMYQNVGYVGQEDQWVIKNKETYENFKNDTTSICKQLIAEAGEMVSGVFD